MKRQQVLFSPALLLTILLSHGQGESPINILSELKQEGILTFDDKSAVKVVERRNKSKILITKDKANDMSLEIFDMAKNPGYIKQLWALYRNANAIRDEMGTLRTFGKQSFIDAVEKGGCYSTFAQIISNYKSSWLIVQKNLDAIEPNAYIGKNEIFEKILDLKEVFKTIDSKGIQTQVSETDPVEQRNYISSIFSKNDSKFNNMDQQLKKLTNSIISFQTFVNLRNP